MRQQDDREDWDGSNRRAAERWKVKKEISLADIISFLSAVGAVIYAYTTLDKRVFSLEQAKAVQTNTDKRQDDDANRYQGRIDEQLRDINRKLDRLVERDVGIAGIGGAPGGGGRRVGHP